MKAKSICAWCNKVLGETETYDGSPSHGICQDCVDRLLTNHSQGESASDQSTDSSRSTSTDRPAESESLGSIAEWSSAFLEEFNSIAYEMHLSACASLEKCADALATAVREFTAPIISSGVLEVLANIVSVAEGMRPTTDSVKAEGE